MEMDNRKLIPILDACAVSQVAEPDADATTDKRSFDPTSTLMAYTPYLPEGPDIQQHWTAEQRPDFTKRWTKVCPCPLRACHLSIPLDVSPNVIVE